MKTTIQTFFALALIPAALASLADSAEIIERTLKVKTEDGWQEINLSWPQIEGLDNAADQAKLNNALFSMFLGTGEAITGEATDNIQLPPTEKDAMHAFQHWTKFKVNYQDETLLCLEKSVYRYTGGAHGMTLWDYRLMEIPSGKPFNLDDVLLNDHSAKLQDLVNQHVPRENLFDKGKPVSLKDSAGWHITPEAFVVHYPHYAIAPYSTGPINVAIPWSGMKPLIKPDGPLARFLEK